MRRIPFFLPFQGCAGRCVYCDQRAITSETEPPSPARVRDVLASLTAAARFRPPEPVEVCFFGGSFARLPIDVFVEYLETINAAPSGSQIVFSTHPGDFSPAHAAGARGYPVRTVELGVPSLDGRVLERCARPGSPEEIKRDIANWRDAMDGRVGVQIMIGLPGQTRESSLRDLEELAEIKGPDQSWDLRIYPCLVLAGTPLEQMFRARGYTPLSLSEAVSICAELLLAAERLGFRAIRVGLLESASLRASVVAGPYHPAFGELALSEKLARVLSQTAPPWQIEKSLVSRVFGHSKFGARRLSELTGIPPADVEELFHII